MGRRNGFRRNISGEKAMSPANPFHTVQDLTGAFIVSRCLHVVADLGVADALDEQPRTAAELAMLVNAHPDALGRVMSLLSAHGVFEARNGAFCHSPASRLLLSDHPQSMRDFVRVFGLPFQWRTYESFAHTVRTGQPAAQYLYSDGYWAYLQENPAERDIFNAAMRAKSYAQVAGVVRSYDFAGCGVIGDIGAGLGHLLCALLDANPDAQGILFELPEVIAQVSHLASDRLALQSGDFFVDELPACDVYVLMEIIHDWDDAKALEILRSVRAAAPPDAKLLLIEQTIPDDPGPDWSKVLDIHMMAMLGGLQRSQEQYGTLLQQAGFELVREIDTGTDISILESAPVS
jgi:hypothetical protein